MKTVQERIEKLEHDLEILRIMVKRLEEAMVISMDGYLKFVEVMQAQYGREKTHT